jgi:glycosyltransferase involved in cell wall biosynthesis
MLLNLFYCKKILKKRVVTHVRSLLETEHGQWRYKIVNYFLKNYSDAVIAIDNNVLKTLEKNEKIHVVHNSLSIENTEEKSCINDKKEIVFGMIGSILRHKGIWEFVQAAELFQKKDCPSKFVIIGGSRREKKIIISFLLKILGLYEDTLSEVKKYIQKNNIKNIFFEGFKTDLNEVYSSVDVVCFPSHLDAPGRPVLEAALYKKPCIIALEKPECDTVIDGKTALCVKKKDVKSLFQAMETLYHDENMRHFLGANARALADQNFNVSTNTQKLLDIYQQVIF